MGRGSWFAPWSDRLCGRRWCWGLLLIISKSSSGSFGMSRSLAADPLVTRFVFCLPYPSMLLGAIAYTALGLDVHVVFGALVCDHRARGDMLFLLRVDVEDVVEPPGRGSTVLERCRSMFQLLMRSRPLWEASSALLSKSSRIDQRPGLNSRPVNKL